MPSKQEKESVGKKLMSLTSSLPYQSALRFNYLEGNKLEKEIKAIKRERQEANSYQTRQWEKTYQWSEEIEKNSGKADFTKHFKLMKKYDENQADGTVPPYYFMYGMRIGKKPKLMKHFLGGQRPPTAASAKSNKNAMSYLDKMESSPLNNLSEEDQVSEQDDKEAVVYNQVMIGNKVVTQVPIGYKKCCKNQPDWFISCSTNNLKEENIRVPSYYKLKYKYIVPPPVFN